MEFNDEGELPPPLALRVFDTPAALAQAVSGRVHQAVMTGVRTHGRASLLVDSAAVLRRAYALLSMAGLPWASVDIALAPIHRLPSVDAGHGASAPASLPDREAELRIALLQGPAAAARFVSSGNAAFGALSAVAADASADHDLVLIAASADGRIATLADGPDGAALGDAAALLASRRIVIVAQGLPARDAFERQVLSADEPASALQALARAATQPIEFCWCR